MSKNINNLLLTNTEIKSFSIILENANDLLLPSASLCLGWFEITYKELNIAFFKQKYCLIFLTLYSLLEYLRDTNNRQYQWVGEDNGMYFILKKDEIFIQINTPHVSINLNYNDFKNTVVKSSHEFREYCLLQNKYISQEPAFIDFVNILTFH